MSEEHRKKYFPEHKRRFELYPFYEKKDNEDCAKKILATTATTGIAGTTFAILAGLTSTTPDNPALGSNMMIRLAKYGLPAFAVGAMFSGTVCASANIRGKDDALNHLLAGLTTGSVIGTAMKSQKIGWAYGIALGLFAAAAKGVITETGWKLKPTTLRREVSFNEYKRSYFTTRPDNKGDPNL